MQLEQNIKGLCSKFGIDFDDFLNDLDVENVHELTVYDLEAVCEEYEIDLQALLFKPLFKPELYKKKLSEIKFLILDVDGVMTDGECIFLKMAIKINDSMHKTVWQSNTL
jgi:3-deoxy-D-manno-octulosonate 8-phosphate phosphatase (KDO 8-P phosphatase)